MALRFLKKVLRKRASETDDLGVNLEFEELDPHSADSIAGGVLVVQPEVEGRFPIARAGTQGNQTWHK